MTGDNKFTDEQLEYHTHHTHPDSLRNRIAAKFEGGGWWKGITKILEQNHRNGVDIRGHGLEDPKGKGGGRGDR